MATHLILRLSSLGDLVLCSALTEEIARRHPGEPIVFATGAEWSGFVREHFPVPLRVEALRRPRFGLVGWIGIGWDLAARYARAGETLRVYDLHGVLKTSLLTWGLRFKARRLKADARVRRSAKHSFRRWLSVWLGRDLLGPRFIYREHLATLPDADSRSTPKLKFTPPVETRAKRILIAPDARHWKKRWLVPHWTQFLDRLLRDPAGYSVTLVGNANCLPRDLRDDLSERFGARVRDRIGLTSLTELPSLAAAHAATVCGNSAWLHISEAVGTPVLSLAGPIVPGFGFSPWRPESIELSVELKCRPCTRHGGGLCRRMGDDFHACMKLVTPDRVWDSLQKLLGDFR